MIVLIVLSLCFVHVSGSRLNPLVWTCLALLLAAQLQTSVNWLQLNYQNGTGYAAQERRESQTLDRVKRITPTPVLYSNAPEILYTLLNKSAMMIPRKTHTDTNLPNQHYPSQISELGRRLKEDSRLLIYFHRVDWRWYLPTAEELEQALGLRALAREDDGVVYQAQ